ncbi:MAG: hypothetical protein A2921_00430 [Candidatus Magasanikbacteria bacterium RIFCSPLOWO2_01_FULL_43_20b]|uniref:Uncharacterized protein n=1 Tax=Candidatus Magasanikbacteria bacterium RIFCSPLOWO2_12_FULL_43_12 TaxID=1798692 RepID=A0A1F6MW04_9BACT|nr:MAG: hypothetical protein A3I93_02685 [Candidatus Magasanikbacteria bacterium RIFCSPLOWO2_02_FULL_43_22]OGH72095.1 MAG: hypothetical protein A3C74_03950 [Candidatus Magasanikbacteria bacterium RIFCSPHIGHO2_02_FULL_44_13]OGH72880.1 MAG: hypothetical protein A2921_00430 [Candidatus Magasanikbacteria bacterium RIFCSPLOWO2_01_FULL_43_20b]OGH75688.1 MAG: hypothetical protein A3G00_04320 [Candidatus Magasanikbacteria bacterium RIFCSPLOWO2_12_FULL_43_12]
MKKFFIFTIIISAILAPLHLTFAHGDAAGTKAAVYYNEACGACAVHVNTDLPALLNEHGVSEIIKKDYISQPGVRVEMNRLLTQYKIPIDLQSHIMAFVGDKYVLGGHVPNQIVEDLFSNELSDKFKLVVVSQDEMHTDAAEYKIFAIPSYANNFVGEPKTYQIDTPVKEYFKYLEDNKNRFSLDDKVGGRAGKDKSLLPVVLVSGFLDGINPCAFAVLLLFIAFLFSLKRTRANIWKMGVVYIAAIFLAYVLIGFGLMKALVFTNSPHLMAKLGAWLVIILGVINIIGLVFPKFPIKLRIPMFSKETLCNWITKATMPAAFVAGFLVGLCTFPCSGGIYVAIIGLLAAKTTYFAGVGYLLLYNLMFIMPLVIILVLAGNKKAVEKITAWEQSETLNMKILSAGIMLLLGIIILAWFT